MKKFNFDNLNAILEQIPPNYKQQKISILLPYYNEAPIIVQNTHEILHKMSSWGFNTEIIVSDDGSSDDGFGLLTKEFKNNSHVKLIRSPRNYGKGRALSTAYEESSGEFILFLDCDLELPIEHLPYFLLQMIQDNADVVIGSKEHPASDLKYPLIRKLFSKGYFVITKILFNLNVQDTQTGVKLFKRKALENTLPYLLVKRFAFDIELLALITHYSYKIISHPIVLQYTRDVQIGRMSLDTILHMFKDTIATFWRLKSGFWNNLTHEKISLKYAVLTFDSNNKAQDTFYISSLTDIQQYRKELNKYDAILFQQKNEEIPVFMFHSLNRIFSNSSINIVLPMLYPYTKDIVEELYYTLLGNMFYPKGLYSRYRPICQQQINEIIDQGIRLCDLIYRKDTFFEMLDYSNTHEWESILNQPILQTPFCYTHRVFPKNHQEFYNYTKSMQKPIQIKKHALNLYLMLSLLFLVGIVSKIYWLVLPLISLELLIFMWYIYSLGIRKGFRFIVLFYSIRIKNIFHFLKK